MYCNDCLRLLGSMVGHDTGKQVKEVYVTTSVDVVFTKHQDRPLPILLSGRDSYCSYCGRLFDHAPSSRKTFIGSQKFVMASELIDIEKALPHVPDRFDDGCLSCECDGECESCEYGDEEDEEETQLMMYKVCGCRTCDDFIEGDTDKEFCMQCFEDVIGGTRITGVPKGRLALDENGDYKSDEIEYDDDEDDEEEDEDTMTNCEYEDTKECKKHCIACGHGCNMRELRLTGPRGRKYINIYVNGELKNIISNHVEDMDDKVRRKEVRKALQKEEKKRIKLIKQIEKNERKKISQVERNVYLINKNTKNNK